MARLDPHWRFQPELYILFGTISLLKKFFPQFLFDALWREHFYLGQIKQYQQYQRIPLVIQWCPTRVPELTTWRWGDAVNAETMESWCGWKVTSLSVAFGIVHVWPAVGWRKKKWLHVSGKCNLQLQMVNAPPSHFSLSLSLSLSVATVGLCHIGLYGFEHKNLAYIQKITRFLMQIKLDF